MRPPWTSLGKSLSKRAVARLAVLALVGAVAVSLWTALAGGTEPNDSYQSAVAADAPAAQYRFDDASGSSTLADSAGTDTATNSGIALAGEGPFGGSKSGSFGGSAYATLSSNPIAGATEFTFEAWVDWAGGASYNQSIFDLSSSSTNFISLTPANAASGHKMVFEMTSSGTTVASVSNGKLPSGSWRYLTVTQVGSKVTLYINGEQVAQTTTLFNPTSLGSLPNDYLGKSHASGEPLFGGSLSNVAFYKKGLSASQVEAHYKAAEKAVNVVAPSITGNPKDGSTLTAKAGTWAGLTPISFSYQWLRCNSAGGECATVGSATSEPKRQAGHEDVGQTLRVAVTGTNSAGSGTATSPQTTPALAKDTTGMREIGRTSRSSSTNHAWVIRSRSTNRPNSSYPSTRKWCRCR